MTREERRQKVNDGKFKYEDIKSFISMFAKFYVNRTRTQFTYKREFDFSNDRMTVNLISFDDEPSLVKEIKVYKHNNKWFEDIDKALCFEYRHFDTGDFRWCIVDYSISKIEEVKKEKVFELILEFIIENSNDIENKRMNRLIKLHKLKI